MAAPSFVAASTGSTDATGAWSATCHAPGAAGRIIVLQVLQDGATDGAVTFTSATNIENLAGTDNQMTQISGPGTNGSWAVGGSSEAFQYIWIGRSLSTSAPTFTGGNTTSEDTYWRFYEFQDASTGTTLATVIENSTAGNATNGVGTSNTASDTAVTTLGPDRLALNLIAVNDDNAISAFTGETGGDWTLAVSPYAESSGTDGAIGLQASSTNQENPTGDGVFNNVYTVAANNKVAASFVAYADMLSVAAKLCHVSSPADNLIIEIQTDSAGEPSGTVLGTKTVTAADLTTTSTYTQFNLSVSLTPGSTYWIVMSRSGALDASHYYRWETSALSSLTVSKTFTAGGSWSAANAIRDQTFGVRFSPGTIDGGTGSIVDSDAWGVVGFALIGTTVAWEQTHYRFRNDDGNETTATWKVDLDTTTTYALGDKFRVRLGLAETAAGDPASETYTLQYSKNGAAFASIGDAAADSPIRAVASVGDPADNSATTQQITTGTFSAGQYEESAAATTKDMARGKYSTEFEWSVEVNAAASSPFAVADVIQLRVKPANETPTYTQTAQFTVASSGPVYQPRDAETFHDFR